MRSIFRLLTRQECSRRRGKALNTRAPLTNRTTTAAAAAVVSLLYAHLYQTHNKHPVCVCATKKIYKIRRTADFCVDVVFSIIVERPGSIAEICVCVYVYDISACVCTKGTRKSCDVF